MNTLGLVATLAMGVLWAWDASAPRRRARAEARAQCRASGHTWGKPFPTMGSWCRSCQRCGHQEHKIGDEWPSEQVR